MQTSGGAITIVGGTNGTNGATWRFATGLPDDALGVNGDAYVDTVTDLGYVKTAGVYAQTFSIKGDKGDTGNTGAIMYNGSGIPDNANGVDGDYYLDTNNGQLYFKTTGTWGVTILLKGTNGTNGATWYYGSGTRPPTITANANDLYLDTDTGYVYICLGGTSWNSTPIAEIKGMPGANGNNGTLWYTGSGDPTAVVAANFSDLLLDLTTGNVYACLGGTSWNLLGNIKGAAGNNGNNGLDATAIASLLRISDGTVIDAVDRDILDGAATPSGIQISTARVKLTKDLVVIKIIGDGTAGATLTPDTGLGTTPTLAACDGSSLRGLITVATGVAPAASADCFSIDFTSVFGAAPKTVILIAANVGAAELNGTSQVYVDYGSIAANQFKVKSGSTALAAGTEYAWYYQVIG